MKGRIAWFFFQFRIFRLLFKERAWDHDFMAEYRVWYSDHSSDAPSRIRSLVPSQPQPGPYSFRSGQPDAMDRALKALFSKGKEFWIQTHTRDQLHLLLKPCEPPPPPPPPPPPKPWVYDTPDTPSAPPPAPEPQPKAKQKRKSKPKTKKKNVKRSPNRRHRRA